MSQGYSDSVRTYFIKFALSFLITGDNDVIRNILELKSKIKVLSICMHHICTLYEMCSCIRGIQLSLFLVIAGFLSSVFKLLLEDPVEIVHLFLSTLQQKVHVYITYIYDHCVQCTKHSRRCILFAETCAARMCMYKRAYIHILSCNI